MLTWKIACRNLLRHKGKSLVVGVILFVGAFVMTLGNAVVNGSKQGLQENMVRRLLGHLIIVSAKERQQEVLFDSERSLRIIPDYPQLEAVLEQQKGIEAFIPMLMGEAMILNEEGFSGETRVLGVDFEEYQRVFLNNVVAVEGELLKPGERGLLIGHKLRENIYDFQKFWVLPEGVPLEPEHLTPLAQQAADNHALTIRNDLVLVGQSLNSLDNDIRLPVKGIVRFQNFNALLASGLSFMDLESYRECFGHVTADMSATELSDEINALLETGNLEEDILLDGGVVEELDLADAGYDVQDIREQTQRTEITIDLNQDVYNIVMVKLHPGLSINDQKASLQTALAETNVEVRVLTWKEAVGGRAQLASIMQNGLMIFVMFIFFVAIIIIMNTLSMAAIERVAEIGMMRAIGARKHFISRLFFAETFSLSFLFSGLGIVTGVLVVYGLAALNLSVADNEMLPLLFGRDTFHPIVDSIGILVGIAQVGVVTVLAMLYPISIARKITPLDAIARD
jgi:ABC-type lipoprotein release transport system permease subunit